MALLACAHQAREVFAPLGVTGDRGRAYRQWPVHPVDRKLLITLVWSNDVGDNGGYYAYAHHALPFGAVRAVWAYTSISQGICAILRRLLAIPQLAYVDDFLRAGPRAWAAAHENASRRIRALLGIFKHDKEGTGQVIKALGHRIGAAKDWAGFQLTPERQAAVRGKLGTALQHGLRSGDSESSAAKFAELAGHFNFGMQSLVGQSSRAFARTMYQAVNGTPAKLLEPGGSRGWHRRRAAPRRPSSPHLGVHDPRLPGRPAPYHGRWHGHEGAAQHTGRTPGGPHQHP